MDENGQSRPGGDDGRRDLKLSGVRVFDGRRFRERCEVAVADGRVLGIANAPRDGAPRAVVTPGVTDAHAHVAHMAARLGEAELAGADHVDDVVGALGSHARERAGWRRGQGLDHLRWRPRVASLKQALDRAFPSTAVRILLSDGHSALLNEAALARLAEWRESGLLAEVKIETDGEGRPTGRAVDGKLELATLPLAGAGEGVGVLAREELDAAVGELARHGITAVHDLLTTIPAYLAFREAALEDVRIYAYFAAECAEELVRLRRESGPGLESDTLRIRGLKCFADGTLGSSGALLTRPYRGDPGNRGFAVADTQDLTEYATFCLEHGLQLAVHAIGDAAVSNVLDAVERALAGRGGGAHSEAARGGGVGSDAARGGAVGSGGPPGGAVRGPSARGTPFDHRFRIEHAEIVREEDLERCRRLSVVVSMQPYHFTDDARWLPERLDPELCAQVSPWRRLVDLGVPVCFGSDAPFTHLCPLDGVRSAVHRLETVDPRHRALFSDGRLTLEEALGCYSAGGAYAVFEDRRFGRLVAGAEADLTVLDPDLRRVLLTMVAGRVTWADEEAREWMF